MKREETRVDLRTGEEMETKTWTGEAAVRREDPDKDQKLLRKEAVVGQTNMQGTLTEGAMVGSHQEPQRKAGAGAGLETCPGMRKTMEDMRQEVPEVAVKGIRNNRNLFFNCTIVIKDTIHLQK